MKSIAWIPNFEEIRIITENKIAIKYINLDSKLKFNNKTRKNKLTNISENNLGVNDAILGPIESWLKNIGVNKYKRVANNA